MPVFLPYDIPSGPLVELPCDEGSNRLQVEASSNTVMATPEQAGLLEAGPSRAHLDVEYPLL